MTDQELREQAIRDVAAMFGWDAEELAADLIRHAHAGGSSYRLPRELVEQRTLVLKVADAIRYSLQVGYDADNCSELCSDECHWCALRKLSAIDQERELTK